MLFTSNFLNWHKGFPDWLMKEAMKWGYPPTDSPTHGMRD